MPTNLSDITSVKPQIPKTWFIPIFVRTFKGILASRCKIGVVVGFYLYIFTTEQIAGPKSKPTSVSNTPRSAVTSRLDLDLPSRANMKTTTTLVNTTPKKSTPMTDNITNLQSSNSVQKPQITRLIVSTVMLHHQNKVPLFVLLCVSHMRTGAVGT